MPPIFRNGKPFMVSGAPAYNTACCCCCFDMDDDFGGTGGNSGSVGDSNYDCRWTNTDGSGGGTFSIVSGSLRVRSEDTSVNERGSYAEQDPSITGDFTITVDWDFLHIANGGGSKDYSYMQLALIVGGTEYNIFRVHREDDGGDDDRYESTTSGGGGGATAATSDTSGTFKLERVSGTLTSYYGATSLKSWTESGTVTAVTISVRAWDANDYAEGEWDNFIAVDGSSVAIGLCD